MDNILLDNITLLSSLTERKKTDGCKLKKLEEKGIRLIDFCSTEADLRSKKVFQTMLLPATALVVLKALMSEIGNIRKREKVVSKLFNVDRNFVTGDLTKFISSGINYPYFVDDFRYDASVSNGCMESLMFVWGNADLRALHDFDHARALSVVVGDLYTSTAENVQGLKNLQVVTGDIHMEQFENVDFLNDSLYVGGNIYTKNGILQKNNVPGTCNIKK